MIGRGEGDLHQISYQPPRCNQTSLRVKCHWLPFRHCFWFASCTVVRCRRHRVVKIWGEPGCVLGIARWLFLPFLPQGDNSAGQCIQTCLHPLLPVTLGSVEKARVHKRDTSQWPQCFSVSTVVSQRRTILNKLAESTPGRPWEKKRPPPGRPQATDSGHPHGFVFVPGVSIWGFAFFCGENGLDLRNWFCFL